MEQIDICPHCGQTLELTGETKSTIRGKVHFRSLACPDCGTRRETRKIGAEAEEVLMTSPPRAEVDAAAQARADAVAAGVKEFFAKGDRYVRHA